MTEFTPEQEAEIQKRIEERGKFEQYRIAGHQAYKECLLHLSQLVDQYDEEGKLVKNGVFDPYVLAVFRSEYGRFMETYFPQPIKKGDEKKAEDTE